MKVHKFTMYAFDHEGYGHKSCMASFDHGSMIVNGFYEGSAEIGEWADDHPLNRAGCNQLTFDKYFKP
jgi:hypothetical protein